MQTQITVEEKSVHREIAGDDRNTLLASVVSDLTALHIHSEKLPTVVQSMLTRQQKIKNKTNSSHQTVRGMS